MSVISVHVGGCGLRTGASFWQALGHEHGIDAGGSAASDKGGRRPVYFDECKDGGWRPRAVLVDTVPGACARTVGSVSCGVVGRGGWCGGAAAAPTPPPFKSLTRLHSAAAAYACSRQMTWLR